MQVIFVVLTDALRVEEADKTTMALVLEAAKLDSDKYSIILNQIPPKILKNELSNSTVSDKLNDSFNKGLKGTKYIHYLTRDEDLQGGENKVKELTSGLRTFIEEAPVAKIENATKIRTEHYEILLELFKYQMVAMMLNNLENEKMSIEKYCNFRNQTLRGNVPSVQRMYQTRFLVHS